MKINQYNKFNEKINIIEPVGPINSLSAPILDEYISELLNKEKQHIVLDFSYVDYVSSAGIGAIIYLQKRITQDKKIFVISGANTEITDLFSILGLNKLFILIQSKDLAIAKIIEEEKLSTSEPVNDNTVDAGTKDIESNIEPSENIVPDSIKNEASYVATEENKENYEKIHKEDNIENLKEEPIVEPIEEIDVNIIDVNTEEEHSKEEIDISAIDIDLEDLIAENVYPENIEPFIWECPNCKNMMQITHTGSSSCSNCSESFIVNKNLTVSF